MFRIGTNIPGWAKLAMGLIPFVLIALLYLWGAHYIRYQAEHPGTEAVASPKLMPLPTEMWDGFQRSALEKDSKGELRLWFDTLASLKRFAIGMAFVALGIILGLYMGAFPVLDALLYRFFVFVKNVPPLLLLPILFIYLDVGELSKVALVIIGVLPAVVLDARKRTQEISKQEIDKARTLGATDQEIAWSIIFPQIMPRMLGTLRLNFQAAWCYVIAGESVAAAAGIGYRIFVLRRYVAMDVIIPYVLWATLIMFALEFTFQWLEKRYRWLEQ